MPEKRLKSIKRLILPLVLFFVFVPTLLVSAFFVLEDGEKTEGLKVVKVIDGDTFETESGERVRLRNVDAPELEYCLGKEAKEFLTNLIEGKNVVLTEEVVGQQNRKLVLVYLDGELVNLRVVENGFGRFHHDKSSQEEILKTAGARAKRDRIGIYSPKCYGKTPDDPECVIKGNIDKNKYVDNKKYYFPGCAQYHFTIVEKDIGEGWFCTEKEAQEAGFVKAKSCPDKSWPDKK